MRQSSRLSQAEPAGEAAPLLRRRDGGGVLASRLLACDQVLGDFLRAGLAATGLLERGRRNARDLQLRELSFGVRGLPAAFEGFRILHLSDLHIDGIPGLADDLEKRLAHLEVDLCVLTGDYRFEPSGPYHQVYPLMEQVVSSIRSWHGIVGVLGNHDDPRMGAGLERIGITMLRNEALALHRRGEELWIAGVDDPHYYRAADLPQALRNVPEPSCKILLAHSPELLGEAEASGISLYLCGHTHAGQIRLPGIGPLLVNARCPRKYAAGEWQYGRMSGFTSSGVGASVLGVRYFCPPEIAVIELTRLQRDGTREDQAFEFAAQ
jgi:predicted MPP superfamily phosphohydrolase